MTEPMPCPWCGGKPRISEYECASIVLFQVNCDTEDCPPVVIGANTAKQAWAAWNAQRGVAAAVDNAIQRYSETHITIVRAREEVADAVKAERERCAILAECCWHGDEVAPYKRVAAAIRGGSSE